MSTPWSLVGNEWAVELLRRQVAQEAARHAYLFAGPPGIGRRTLALRFAQALNCLQPVAPGEPCGRCRNCVQIARQQHPDLLITQAEAEGRTLKVDQIRETRRTLVMKPYQARFRVALFPRFQETSDGASNALLKTLEEAPSYAVLILTADDPEQLLPTIVSRCEVLRLRPASLDQVEAFVAERIAAAQAAHKVLPGAAAGAALIAHLSGGRPGYAARLLEDDSLLAQRAEWLADLQAVLSGSRVERFAYAGKFRDDRDGLRRLLLTWLSFWRDVLLRAGGAQTPPANLDRARDIEALAQRLPLAQVRRLVTGLEQALDRLEANVNTRLLAEVLLLDLPRA